MRKKDLYIPINVPDRNEMIPGFGTVELVACAIAVGIAAIVGIIMYMSGINVLYVVGTAVAIITVAIMIFRKDRYGENLIFKTQYVIAYHKSQKKYEYKYHNIYEGDIRRE